MASDMYLFNCPSHFIDLSNPTSLLISHQQHSQIKNKQMDYSITRQLTSKLPERVSTQQIKAGLERIKRAQEQVLSELKRNHPDSSIDVRATPPSIYHRVSDHDNLQRQLSAERERSNEKSTLYRRRVVDLENSLATHEQNEDRLRAEKRALEDQLRQFRNKYSQLEREHQQLITESEFANRNTRNLEQQLVELSRKSQHNDSRVLRTELENMAAECDSLKSEKVSLLKNIKKLEAEINSLRQQFTKAEQRKHSQYEFEEVKRILNEIERMNTAHEQIFSAAKASKLPRGLIQRENEYQNSLNRVLEQLYLMQQTATGSGVATAYRFDHEESFNLQLQRLQAEFTKKQKRELANYKADKEELESKLKSRDKKLDDLQTESKQTQAKITALRKEKAELLQEITTLTEELSREKQQARQPKKKERQPSEDYQAMILELNQQMLRIEGEKKELDGLVAKMNQSRMQEDGMMKKRIRDLEDNIQNLKVENDRLRAQNESCLLQKEKIELNQQETHNKNLAIAKEMAREVLQKEKIMGELNKVKQSSELQEGEIQKYKLQTENTKAEAENKGRFYLLELENQAKEMQLLRQEIEELLRDRQELRDLKGKYGLLLKDNQILGKKAKYSNSQIDHLWMIKEVEYQNLTKIMTDLKPF